MVILSWYWMQYWGQKIPKHSGSFSQAQSFLVLDFQYFKVWEHFKYFNLKQMKAQKNQKKKKQQTNQYAHFQRSHFL